MLCPIGFAMLLHAILRLRPGGVLWAAPPCSAWVFMSRHSSGRDVDVRGRQDSPYIQGQDALAERLVFLLEVATVRGA